MSNGMNDRDHRNDDGAAGVEPASAEPPSIDAADFAAVLDAATGDAPADVAVAVAEAQTPHCRL